MWDAGSWKSLLWKDCFGHPTAALGQSLPEPCHLSSSLGQALKDRTLQQLGNRPDLITATPNPLYSQIPSSVSELSCRYRIEVDFIFIIWVNIIRLMRHVCLSHETSVANTLLKEVLTKLLLALDSREKHRAGGRREEGHYWGSLALYTETSCLYARQLV